MNNAEFRLALLPVTTRAAVIAASQPLSTRRRRAHSSVSSASQGRVRHACKIFCFSSPVCFLRHGHCYIMRRFSGQERLSFRKLHCRARRPGVTFMRVNMGRRKIKISPIKDDKNRSITFGKRRNGLFKKVRGTASPCGCSCPACAETRRSAPNASGMASCQDVRGIYWQRVPFAD